LFCVIVFLFLLLLSQDEEFLLKFEVHTACRKELYNHLLRRSEAGARRLFERIVEAAFTVTDHLRFAAFDLVVGTLGAAHESDYQ
jgi:hypothetical protein